MGSSLVPHSAVLTSLIALIVGSLPVDLAAQNAKGRAAKAPAAQFVPAGVYTLTAFNGRPVRNVDLARSRATFTTDGRISVATACNTIGGSVQSRQVPGQIIGFGQLLMTQMGCVGGPDVAERQTLQILRDTMNIARAGSTLTFFNARGDHIAQWTALGNTALPPPQTTLPLQLPSGDYVLIEINGAVVGSATPQPTLFLRENGSISGSTGCNRYNTAILSARQTQAGFAPVITTKMTCLSPEARRLERQLLDAFRTTARLDADMRQMEFYATNGTRLARFTAIGARPDAAPKRPTAQ